MASTNIQYLKVLSTGKGGGHEWYQSIGVKFLYISADCFTFLKSPGTLNFKKTILSGFTTLPEACLNQVASAAK